MLLPYFLVLDVLDLVKILLTWDHEDLAFSLFCITER